jgi:putative flippase GtrA
MPALTAAFIRFLLIGATGTGLHFAVLGAGMSLNLDPVLASQAGALAGAVWNYQFNRRMNYRTSLSHRHTAPRFAGVALAGFVLNGGCVAMLVHGLSWSPWWAQCCATSLVLAWNFLSNHFWTFKGSR